jgi:hypothetical protein
MAASVLRGPEGLRPGRQLADGQRRAPLWRLPPRDHPIDKAVRDGLVAAEIAVALDLGVDPLDRLASVLGVELVDPAP